MVLKKEGNKEGNRIADRLPVLSEAEQKDATKPVSVSWALELASQDIGYVWVDHERTYCVLQVSAENTLRCVRVYNYEDGFWFLSMVRATWAVAGIRLELDGYALVQQPPRLDEGGTGSEDRGDGDEGGEEVQTSMTESYDEEFIGGWA
ncbi:MAG: hypothetical protein MKZ55_04295 [Candidatus Thalassarchaeum sp.]|nr:hypothetical protein [Candidatus Thalassarchaeum sp.]